MEQSKAIDFDKSGGIIPAIAQDFRSHRILMVAWMNRDAFEETVRTRRACYYSRSRARLWRKGEESGNFQTVHEIRIDCDADIVLLMVEQNGDRAACHEGFESCFFRRLDGDTWTTVDSKVVDPAKYGPSYGHHPPKA